MSEMSLGRAITRLARLRPDEVAALDDVQQLTWDELDRRSNALARTLIEHGVSPDDVVTFALGSGVDFVVLTVAVWKAGATPQPLPPDLPAADLEAVLEQSRPTVTVGLGNGSGGRAVLDESVLRSPPASDGELPDHWAASWKAPVSSGSTGRPKVIFSAGPARIDPTRPTAPYIPAEAVQLVPAPLHHAAQFLFGMRGLLLGHRLVLMPRFDAAAVLELTGRHGVTWMLVNPPAMQRIWQLGEAARRKADVSTIERVLHVGAPCPPELKRAWLDWLGPERVDEIYSGTESIGVTHIGGLDWLVHPGSVGRPTQGCELRILDETGHAVPSGTVGRVFLRPRGGAGSTYRYGGGDSAESVDGHETLGDLGRVDDEGYLYLVDRAADVITTSSGRVYPADVEAVFAVHPAVRTCVATGRGPADHRAVHVVLDVGTTADVHTADLQAWARDRLPAHAVPTGIEIVREPVRDDFGKARRSAFAAAEDADAPRS